MSNRTVTLPQTERNFIRETGCGVVVDDVDRQPRKGAFDRLGSLTSKVSYDEEYSTPKSGNKLTSAHVKPSQATINYDVPCDKPTTSKNSAKRQRFRKNRPVPYGMRKVRLITVRIVDSKCEDAMHKSHENVCGVTKHENSEPDINFDPKRSKCNDKLNIDCSKFDEELNIHGSEMNKELNMYGPKFEELNDGSKRNEEMNIDASKIGEKSNNDLSNINKELNMDGSKFEEELTINRSKVGEAPYPWDLYDGPDFDGFLIKCMDDVLRDTAPSESKTDGSKVSDSPNGEAPYPWDLYDGPDFDGFLIKCMDDVLRDTAPSESQKDGPKVSDSLNDEAPYPWDLYDGPDFDGFLIKCMDDVLRDTAPSESQKDGSKVSDSLNDEAPYPWDLYDGPDFDGFLIKCMDDVLRDTAPSESQKDGQLSETGSPCEGGGDISGYFMDTDVTCGSSGPSSSQTHENLNNDDSTIDLNIDGLSSDNETHLPVLPLHINDDFDHGPSSRKRKLDRGPDQSRSPNKFAKVS